ncbi:MAG TPA: hypothetical protein PLG50_00155 [bacterium]|nr:hypothetical protein [bacterium]HQG44051.1 hypothetical protein [bacterium]HQI48794.1 hypothetical protein [bacterium]HQJ63559.1 hypothetical protein [bacterium]
MIHRTLSSALTRLVSLKRLWLLYYLPGLIFAALVAIPFRAVLSDWAGSTLAAGRLGEGLDMTFFIELIKYRGNALSPLLLLALLLALLYWLWLLFLSGGAVKLLGTDHPWRPREFWDACGRYFGRFLRIFLWSVPLLSLLLLFPWLLKLPERLIWGKDPGDNITLLLSYLKMASRFLALMLWALFFDYGRILTVARNEKRSRCLLRPLLLFLFHHFGRILLLAIFLSAISLVGILIYTLIANRLAASAAAALFLFIWQQLYMFFRAGMRLLGLGAQVQLYLRLART